MLLVETKSGTTEENDNTMTELVGIHPTVMAGISGRHVCLFVYVCVCVCVCVCVLEIIYFTSFGDRNGAYISSSR